MGAGPGCPALFYPQKPFPEGFGRPVPPLTDVGETRTHGVPRCAYRGDTSLSCLGSYTQTSTTGAGFPRTRCDGGGTVGSGDLGGREGLGLSNWCHYGGSLLVCL